MIPLRLSVRDFLSYGDPDPIDFTGFEVACLSGPNGSGKSALLDAITWALFGAARGCEGGQNQDRLIRDGAEEALVDLEFSLNDSVYRIVRRRTRAGKGELRFLVADGDDWRNIADETLRETDARISSTLRMDYRTFTASAFFVQGRAEDFLARMRPDERKEVFARLLDLGAYERLEEASRSRAREAEARRAEHARRAEELAPAADELPDVEKRLADARSCARQAGERSEGCAREVEARRVVVTELEKSDARREAERKGIADLDRTLDQTARALEQRRREMQSIEELLARAEEVRDARAEAARLAGEEREARQRQARAFELEKRRTAAAERLEGERRSVEVRLGECRSRLEAVAERSRELERWERKLESIKESLGGSRDPGPAIAETRAAADEQRAAEARLGEELRSIQATLAEVAERTALLRRGEGECPVCGSALDAEHRRRVGASLRAQARELEQRRDAARAARETARKEGARCAEEIKRLEKALREREKLAAEREAIAARIERGPAVRAELAKLEAAAAEDARLLQDGELGKDLRDEIERLGREISEVYDAAAHEALRARISEIEERYGSLAGRLEEAATRRTALGGELDDLSQRLEQMETSLAERRRGLEVLEAAVAGLPAAREELLEAALGLEELRRTEAEALSEAARLGERLTTLQRTAEQREEAARAEREAATEHRRFRRLTEAFGRGGIPDLVIDNARPDLEEDANDILSRLTDFEMSVHFAMQRDTRAGKAKETFDVLVRHDGGLRDFAMFSGGEAFRIAFAVRLALSKLLVRRAGARLETLVIDEGFGTQDPAGRERLIEAIDIARTEFAKVLVITHLDDLKDVFGARIQVEKDPSRGSTVRISGR